MLDTLNDTIKCLFWPYDILFGISFLVVLFKRKKIALFILSTTIFFILWRAEYSISTSRYVCAIIAIALVSIVLSFSCTKRLCVSRKVRPIVYSVITIIILFNLLKVFSSFRNTYVFDLREEFSSRYKQDRYNSIIATKGHKRLYEGEQTNRIKIYQKDIDYSDVLHIYEQYFLFQKDTIVIKKDKNGEAFNPFYVINPHVESKKLMLFYTNKNKNAFYSFFELKKFFPSFLAGIDPILDTILKDGQLKTLSLKDDTYIFQVKNDLYWIIGTTLSPKTEIIYHIITDDVNLLPLQRQKYGYENKGFHIDSKNRIKNCGKYTIFKSPIPNSYPIKRVRTGFKSDGTIQWFPFFDFQISQYDE